MVDYNQWLNEQAILPAVTVSSRAVLAWRRIARAPQSVILARSGTALSAQTVRIELGASANEQSAAGGVRSSMRTGTLFGVKGHPSSSVADTNIQRGDIFSLNGTKFRVVHVNDLFPGEIQAEIESFG